MSATSSVPLPSQPVAPVQIRLDEVSLRRGDRVILDRVSLELNEHRVGVIGLNGSGKSTLVRLINGLVAPDSGAVHVDDIDVRTDAARVRRQVGFVFSDPDAQIIMPTPREDIAFSLRRNGFAPDEVRRQVSQALAEFGLTHRADAPAHLLSGGEKQLLALASVLITQPRVVILDEPTTLLDLRNARMITERIAALAPMVILVTHHLDQLDDFDRVIVIDQARVAADAAPAEAIAAYRTLAS